MKKLGMLIRVSCSSNNHQAYILFICFLKNKKKNQIKYAILHTNNMPVKVLVGA